MFGFLRPHPREGQIARLHAAVVAAARRPGLYDAAGLPDSFEGRFEALTLHVLVVLRRLRALPAPAADVAQELVDAVFADLEIAMRETGVGDMGVPKKMKKLGGAFYDRLAKYGEVLDGGDEKALADEIARRLGAVSPPRAVAADIAAAERALAGQDLAGILAGPAFPAVATGGVAP